MKKERREKEKITPSIAAITFAWLQGISRTPLGAKYILPVAPLFVFVFQRVPFVWNKQIIYQPLHWGVPKSKYHRIIASNNYIMILIKTKQTKNDTKSYSYSYSLL